VENETCRDGSAQSFAARFYTQEVVMTSMGAVTPVKLWAAVLDRLHVAKTGQVTNALRSIEFGLPHYSITGVACLTYLMYGNAEELGAGWSGSAFCWKRAGIENSTWYEMPSPVLRWLYTCHEAGPALHVVDAIGERMVPFGHVAQILRQVTANTLLEGALPMNDSANRRVLIAQAKRASLKVAKRESQHDQPSEKKEDMAPDCQ
jgi:hypothetical protein